MQCTLGKVTLGKDNQLASVYSNEKVIKNVELRFWNDVHIERRFA
jgi:hypothetical protein